METATSTPGRWPAAACDLFSLCMLRRRDDKRRRFGDLRLLSRLSGECERWCVDERHLSSCSNGD